MKITQENHQINYIKSKQVTINEELKERRHYKTSTRVEISLDTDTR